MGKSARDNNFRLDTKLVLAGRDHDDNKYDGVGIVNPPIYRASTILYKTLDHILGHKKQEFTYGRHGTVPAANLCQAITQLEQGHGTVLTPCGLNAITTLFFSVLPLKKNPAVLITDNTYEPVRNFARDMLTPMGVQVIYFDPMDLPTLEKKIAEHEKNLVLVWLESPGSQSFEICDVPAIVALARAKNILVASDNTWGAGVFFNPIKYGVNFVMQSLTKYVGGHADSLMGSVTADNAENYALLDRARRALGISVSADDCYMMLRGLHSLTIRLRHHESSTLWLLEKLKTVKQVRRILHPAMPDSPGHRFWQRDFSGSAGLFAVVVDGLPKNKLADFLDNMQLFKMGFSWGGMESLILPQCPVRSVTPWTMSSTLANILADGGGGEGILLRLQIGLEDKEDLWQDLQAAFERAYH